MHEIPDYLLNFSKGMVQGESGLSRSAVETVPKTPPPHNPGRPSNRTGGKHSLFAHFLVTCANAQRSRELHADGILKVEKTGYQKQQQFRGTITANRKVHNEEQVAIARSMCGGDTRFGYWIDAHFSVQKQLQRFLHPESKPGVMYTENSLVFTDNWRRPVVQS